MSTWKIRLKMILCKPWVNKNRGRPWFCWFCDAQERDMTC